MRKHLIRILAAFSLATPAYAQVTRSDSVLETEQFTPLLEVREGPSDSPGALQVLPDGTRVQRLEFYDPVTQKGDVSLTGLWSSRYVSFGIPEGWDLKAPLQLHLDVMRSEQLIPEVSAITVWFDGHPVGTFLLDGEPGKVTDEVLTLPASAGSGRHTLQFNAYQRSWMPCELSDHPGLWSRLMASSYVEARYRPLSPAMNLSKWPAPFLDPDDPTPSRVVLLLPAAPSEEELLTAGYLASALGAGTGRRRLDLLVHKGSLATAPEGNVIAVGRADRGSLDPFTALLRAASPEAAAVADEIVAGKLEGAGALAFAPRPGAPERAVLVLAGRDGLGLVKLGQLLSSGQASGLPAGQAQNVTDVKSFDPAEPREWRRTAPPEESFTLADLGYGDLTAVGFRGGSVILPLRRVPDDRPLPDGAKIELVYSYSAQASPANSRLDVLMDGSGTGGRALDSGNGGTREKATLDLAVHHLGPDGTLAVRFDLVGKEEPICLGEHQDELWGTVHSDTRITFPRERVARPNDLTNLHFGGYPFGIPSDLSQTLFLLPANPDVATLQMYAWLAAELGRNARGDRFAYGLRLGGLRTEADRDAELIVVDVGADAPLLRQLNLLQAMWMDRNAEPTIGTALATGAKVMFAARPSVAWFETLALPWQPKRSALVAHAEDVGLFTRVGRSAEQTPLFDRLGGRVSRVAAYDDVAQVVPAPPPPEPAPAVARVFSLPTGWLGWSIALASVALVAVAVGWWRRRDARVA